MKFYILFTTTITDIYQDLINYLKVICMIEATEIIFDK